MVTLHHFITSSALYKTMLVANAWLFVDFFFVLSGFVIAANYGEKLGQGFGLFRFLTLRLGRLYPLHIVLLLAFIVTEALLFLANDLIPGSGRAYFSGATSPTAIVTSVLMLQGMGLQEGLVWNGVAWSISVEMFAYVVFGAVAIMVPKRVNLAMLAFIALSFAIILLADLDVPVMHRFIDAARCVYGFSIGVLLNALYSRLTRFGVAAAMSVRLITGLELVTLGVGVAFVGFAAALPAHALAPLAFAPIVLIYAFDRGRVSRLLAHPAFMTLGTLSFSIYMIHPFVQSRLMLPAGLIFSQMTGITLVARDRARTDAAFVWGGNEWLGALCTVIMLGLVVWLSRWTYRLIEAPGRTLARRWVLDQKRAIDTPMPAALEA